MTRPAESTSTGLVAFSARPRRRSRPPLLVSALVLQGCVLATAVYPGPKRPSSEVAIIAARNLTIEEIDGINVIGKGSRFEVLPGDHMVVVDLTRYSRVATVPSLIGGRWLKVGTVNGSGPMPICVSVKRKKLLRARADATRCPLANCLRRLPEGSGPSLRAPSTI
jgi:hypothetical protein